MSKECKRKFGVKRISKFNLDLICEDCGRRAGLHYGSDCPIIDIQTGKSFRAKKMEEFNKNVSNTVERFAKKEGLI